MGKKITGSLERLLPIFFGLYVIALPSSMSLMEMGSGLLSLGLLLYFIFAKPKRSAWILPPFFKPMLAFVVVVVVGVVFGQATLRQNLYDIGRMRFVLIYAVCFYYLKFFDVKRTWIRLLLFSTLIVGIYAFFQHFTTLNWHVPDNINWYAVDSKHLGHVVVGTFGHHLSFSNIYLFYACLFLSLGLYYFPKRLWYVGMSAFIYLLILWAQSRTAWLAVPLTLLGIGAARGWKMSFVSLAAIAALFALFVATDAGFRERFENGFLGKEEQHDLGPRFKLWNAQWHFFKKSPLWGVGYNNNERQSQAMVDELYPNTVSTNFYGHAHSTPLQLLATTGLLGVLTYCWIWWEVFRFNATALSVFTRSRIEYWLALACLVAYVGFHFQGLTQWNFGDAKVVHNLIFFWAVLASLDTRRQR